MPAGRKKGLEISHLNFINAISRFRSLTNVHSRAGPVATNYPFLTLKERDVETDLDYLINRYYSSTQGRFTSVDPENAGSYSGNPQTWNGYSYALNQPTLYSDPDGLTVRICGTDGQCTDKKSTSQMPNLTSDFVEGKISSSKMEKSFRTANKSERSRD